MDLVVAVAIIVLMIVFLGSLTALIFICRHRCKAREAELDRKPILNDWSDGHQRQQSGQDSFNNLLNSNSLPSADVELEDVLQLSPNIEKIIKDHQWVFDSGGLIEQCLAILRTCHVICDRLSSVALNPCNRFDQDVVEEVRMATKRVLPRVDDLVHTMYTASLNRQAHACLLEARAAALVMSVNTLALVFRASCRRANVSSSDENAENGENYLSWTVNWINSHFNELECRLSELRRIADAQPANMNAEESGAVVGHTTGSDVAVAEA